MLPGYIVERILEREKSRDRVVDRPRKQLDLPVPPLYKEDEEETERGVVIIDL